MSVAAHGEDICIAPERNITNDNYMKLILYRSIHTHRERKRLSLYEYVRPVPSVLAVNNCIYDMCFYKIKNKQKRFW